jgi:hypothetical protein
MTETREAAQERRAQARQKRREDLDRTTPEGGTDDEQTSTDRSEEGGNGKTEETTGALSGVGQRLTSKTVAAAAAVGASLGAATLAGRKLLAARRKRDSESDRAG